MIVDLLRNDLSRVCMDGSVAVPRLCALERFATVMHLVSRVTGRLRAGAGAVDLLTACFPGGSITGAPKIRAMEIIAALEPVRRGPYCGAIAYLGFDGAMDSSIVIRSYAVRGRRVSFHAGAGIVADSRARGRVRGDAREGPGADGGPVSGGPCGGPVVLLIDNYDSFVHNLARYVRELGQADRRSSATTR